MGPSVAFPLTSGSLFRGGMGAACACDSVRLCAIMTRDSGVELEQIQHRPCARAMASQSALALTSHCRRETFRGHAVSWQ